MTDTMNTDQSDVAEKVRKLLAKAEDPGATMEEAEAFSEKAQELMSRYQISLAMVADLKTKSTEEIVMDEIIIKPLFATRKVFIANVVALANDCRGVQSKCGPGTVRFRLVGYRSDVEWVKTLYASLETQLARDLTRSAKFEKPARVHGREWGTAFTTGYSTAINNRLQDARRAAVRAEQEQQAEERRELVEAALEAGEPVPEETSVALVLVEKAKTVEAEYKKRVGKTHAISRSSGGAGYGSGHKAGSNASLARGSVGTKKGLGR